MQFPVGILAMFLIFAIGILIVTWPKRPTPAKPRFLVIDTKEEKKD